MKTIRWGIIGMGRFGMVHARTLRDLPGSELIAFSNRNPERLAAAAGEFGEAKFEVIGTEGTLAIDCSHTGLTVLDANGPKAIDTVYWPAPHGRQAGALAAELAYFADCIRTGQPPSAITPVEAGRAVAAMEAAERSSKRKQPVPFSFL